MNKIERNAVLGARASAHSSLYRDSKKLASLTPEQELAARIDALSTSLGVGQVRMRNKQAVFRPNRMVMNICAAFHVNPPPLPVVQFNNWGVKTTFPVYA